MAVHPQGKLVATSGADNFIRLWEHARDYKFEGSVGGRTSDMAFSPDGQFLSRASRIVERYIEIGHLFLIARRIHVPAFH